ncbi:MAG: hypothetical protein WC637_17590 [Victivallales bacterium]|jgi:hypothetical protein
MNEKPTDQATTGNTGTTQDAGKTEGAAAAATQQQATGATNAGAATAQTQTGKKDDGKSLLGGDETASGTQTQEDQGAKKDEGKESETVPEKYEFKTPDGMQIDPQALEAATPVLKELGLPQSKAQKLVDVYAALQKEQTIRAETALINQRKAWREEITKAPDGAETVSMARKAIKQLGDETFANMVTTSWMGDHPSVIRFLANVGRLIGDDRIIDGSRGSLAKPTLEQRFYPNQK